MKILFVPALLCLASLLAPLPLQAVSIATNGTQAKKLVKDDGYIIFAYADGWDAFSKVRCEALMKAEAVRRAAGDAVFMPLPIPEQPNEARRKKQDELRGGLNIPGSMSYPALIMLDSGGWHYATLAGRELARGSAEEVAALISDRKDKLRERCRLIAEADNPANDGPTRARKLAAAYQIDGLNWPGNDFANRLTKLDPKDEAGTVRAWKFNAHGFPHELNKMSLQEAMAEVDKRLADPAYTPRQKQLMCAAVLGTLRRRGAMGEADAMRRYAKLMQELVPGTPESGAAPKILRDWIPGFYYHRGWNPSCIPDGVKPVELMGELPIKGKGCYAVSFQYTGGRMALVVEAVELYDGKKKVAEDRHRGVAGHNNWQNTYTLKVPKTVKNPRIFVTINLGDRDSYGKIHIEKK